MRFSYNRYQKLETPQTFLAYPNKKIICEIPATDRKTEFSLVNPSTYNFSINKYKDGVKFKYYDEIQIGRYLEFRDCAWFRITDVSTEGDGLNETLSVTASSLEIETSQTYVTALGSLGTDEDDQGGLDIYCLYSETDQAHSILHKFFEKNPTWSMGYFDSEIKNEYRIVSEESITSYDLLMSTAMELWECIFLFDTFKKTVSAYKVENVGKVTSIYLAYRNLIKKTTIEYNIDDVKTVFYVVGGTDATNTTLSIADVNPSGNGYISNYNYFLKDMSKELREKYQEYQKKMADNLEPYQNAMAKMQELYDTLANLYNAHPDKEDSTDWTQYGSVELKGRIATFKNLMSIYNDDSSGKTYQEAYTNYTNASAELTKREKQIEDCNNQLEAAQELAKTYVVNIQDYLGDELYKELSLFNREDTFSDDSFVATDAMTESDVFKMKKALLEHSQNELAKVCFPQFTMTVDSINFPKIFRYKKYTDQLELGNIVTINMEDGYDIEARILKISINWDNPSDFSLTFSSKTSLEDNVFEYEEIKNEVSNLGNSLGISSSAWNNASQSSATILTDMSTFLNASLREVQNSKDNEVNMDGTGITIRKSNGDGTYDPNQLWMTRGNIIMTDDGWKSVKIAIGSVEIKGQRIFGIAADQLIGRMMITETMYIQNKNNSFTIDDKGLVAKSSSNNFSLTINPDDPSAIFTIKNGDNTILGVDASVTPNKFVFKGTLESTDGHIGGWTIGKDSLTADNGSVGLSSALSSSIKIWAGGTDANNAPYRVGSDGSLYTSKINVQGGNMQIGNIFSVNSSGVDITGRITATSGKIGGFEIQGNNLSGAKGAQIQWGALFIDGDSAELNDLMVNGDFYAGGLYDSGTDGDGTWIEADGGTIHTPELYIKASFWGGMSVTEKVEKLWNTVYGGGWNPCKRDYSCEEDTACKCEGGVCICDGKGDAPCIGESEIPCEGYDGDSGCDKCSCDSNSCDSPVICSKGG